VNGGGYSVRRRAATIGDSGEDVENLERTTVSERGSSKRRCESDRR